MEKPTKITICGAPAVQFFEAGELWFKVRRVDLLKEWVVTEYVQVDRKEVLDGRPE